MMSLSQIILNPSTPTLIISKESIMEVKHLYNLVYDIFTGHGWEQWTRVLYARKEGKVIPLKGAYLNKHDMENLLQYFKKEYKDV